MPFLALVTLPSPTDFFASTTEWASPLFTDLLPFVYVAIGVILAIGLVVLLPRIFMWIFHK